eukprot:s573_g8.t1
MVAFWLGPWNPTAVAIGHCICFLVLIAFVFVGSSIGEENLLRDADLTIHLNEIPALESSPNWRAFVCLSLLDWSQYVALAFSLPDIELPPSVQDLFDAFSSFFAYLENFLADHAASLAELLTGTFFSGMRLLWSLGFCVYCLFFLASPLLKALITNLLHPAEKEFSVRLQLAFDRSRWKVAGQRLRTRFRFGGWLFRTLDVIDEAKVHKDVHFALCGSPGALILVLGNILRTMACVEVMALPRVVVVRPFFFRSDCRYSPCMLDEVAHFHSASSRALFDFVLACGISSPTGFEDRNLL